MDKAVNSPNRLVAFALALFAPRGTGHCYVGLWRRGASWCAVESVGLMAAAVSVVAFEGSARLVALGALAMVYPFSWLGAIVDLALLDRGRFARTRVSKVVLMALLFLVVGFGTAFITRGFVMQAFKIRGSAMWPTLLMRDYVFVTKSSYGSVIPLTQRRIWQYPPPKRGDVMIFEYPNSDPFAAKQDYVKRVIATSGDTLQVEDGHPRINGWQVPHCRVGEYEQPGSPDGPATGDLYVEFLGDNAYLIWLDKGITHESQGPYRVSPNESWVLGDNRNNSSDSRFWRAGAGAGVPDSHLKGRALVVWLAIAEDGSPDWQRVGTDPNAQPRLPPNAPQELVEGLRRCLAQRPPQTLPPHDGK